MFNDLIFYDDFVVGGVGDAEGAEADGGAVEGAAPGFEGSLAVVELVSTGFTSIFWGCLCEDGGDPPWLAGTSKLKKFKW